MQEMEGIVLSKILYGEKHAIADLLLRDGELATVLFFGGHGGRQANSLEVGNALRILPQRKRIKKNEEGPFWSSREWRAIWSPHQLRNHFSAFSLAGLYVAVVRRIASKGEKSAATFALLSNSLFYLNAMLENEPKNVHDQSRNALAFLFFVKLVHALGIWPTLNQCETCNRSIERGEKLIFALAEGGVWCPECSTHRRQYAFRIRDLMQLAAMKKISEYRYFATDFEALEGDWKAVLEVFSYVCHHLQLVKGEFTALRWLTDLPMEE
jgi:recombinational DNA repair protein (RecF pathway)